MVEVGAYAGSGGDAGAGQHFAHQLHRQFVSCEVVCLQVVGGIDEDFVDGIDMYVVGRDEVAVDVEDACAVFHVESHAGRSGDVVDSQFGVGAELRVAGRLAGETVVRGVVLPFGIDFAETLDHLEEAGTSGDAVGLERWRDGKADGLFGA